MIALAFVVCLQTDPQVCQDRNLLFSDQELTPMACLMQAQTRLAEWSNAHPRWRIAKWKCGRIKEGKNI